MASAADAARFFSLVVRRRVDDVRVVDLYVRLRSTLDRESLGDFLVSHHHAAAKRQHLNF